MTKNHMKYRKTESGKFSLKRTEFSRLLSVFLSAANGTGRFLKFSNGYIWTLNVKINVRWLSLDGEFFDFSIF